MNILHIANSYGGTEVYTNLYTAIDQNADITQWVYVPLNVRNHDRVGKKIIEFKNGESKIYYATILNKYHKYLYGAKINAIVKDVEHTFKMGNVDLIHAGTLCLDGAVAYELHKKYGTPYVVAVRSTDIFSYYKKLFWRRSYFTRILLNAEKVIFISPKYKEAFIANLVPVTKKAAIEKKMLVLPNGVNSLFLKNRYIENHESSDDFRLIFVSAFFERKGLIETIQAIEKVRNNGFNISINAIGKGLPNRPQDSEYINAVEALAKNKQWVKLQPFKTAEEIIQEMRSSDAFIMVSARETFGLVYVEALTQGLPILYAKNEGFDGFYPDGFVGYPAQAGNVDSIAESIQKLVLDYSVLSENVKTLDLNKDFEWNKIGQKYLTIYKEVLSK